jgi:alkylhydroperoxidase family enzyme
MKNPALIIPGAMEALQNLAKASEQGGVSKKTLAFVHLRASQIRGCSVCVDMGLRFKKPDETNECLFAVAASPSRETWDSRALQVNACCE